MKDVIIIGGGLAGLINAIQLANAGLGVLVIEKKTYPFHRVCGEYISNEVLPFLKSIDAYPEELYPAEVRRLKVSAPSGNSLEIPLRMGGFGISRYAFDEFLYQKALSKGVDFLLNTSVMDVKYEKDIFEVELQNNSIVASRILIGSFGKRSNLDRQMNRDFFYKRSPYVGVKYHIKTDAAKDLIALHNFKNGYCGISPVEGERFCLCYLSGKENLQQAGDIPSMEESVLYKNPHLKSLFQNSDFLFDKPEVINEISFEKKAAVDQHVLMSGDAAGMITPLCGNGMAMAIHSANVLSELIIKHCRKRIFHRSNLEKEYEEAWGKLFARRMYVGRKIQNLFGGETLTGFSIALLKISPGISKWLVRQTHGKTF